jgi:hypothetical protein
MKKLGFRVFHTALALLSSLGLFAMSVSQDDLAVDIVAIVMQSLVAAALVALWSPRAASVKALRTLAFIAGTIMALMLAVQLFLLLDPRVRDERGLLILVQIALLVAQLGIPFLLYAYYGPSDRAEAPAASLNPSNPPRRQEDQS